MTLDAKLKQPHSKHRSTDEHELLSHRANNLDYSTSPSKSSSATPSSHSQINTSSPWLRKPLWAASDKSTQELHRHLSLFDLIAIGIGGTIGSGIFALCGLIAHSYAGPATMISWAIAGVAACASGVCYAELAGKLPCAGSSYVYAYVSMGELPAVIAGACLTLEYMVSASAVARSWGDKICDYIRVNHIGIANASTGDVGDAFESNGWLIKLLDPGWGVNPMAFLVSAASVWLLLNGVTESQRVTNIFTVLKVLLVLFMSFGALALFQKDNMHPFVPVEFGVAGIFRGATSSFFGYIGFDEICCMSGEAINPARNMPRAVLGTVGIVTILYMIAALGLVGMVPYREVSVTSGFPDGFNYRGVVWAAHICAIGEIVTLPIVVLVSLMAQPRLQYAMASDGLLPPIFAHINDSGNIWYGTLLSGILMIATSTFVPFNYLDDLISAGILLAFVMTDSSLILLRQESPKDQPFLLESLLVLFNVVAIVLGLLLGNCFGSFLGKLISFLTFVILIILSLWIGRMCPMTSTFGGGDGHYFQTPFVPYLPLFGSFVNWYLVTQLEAVGLLLLVAYVGVAAAFYFIYGAKHSVGKNGGWGHSQSRQQMDFDDELSQKPLQTIISLPLVESRGRGLIEDEADDKFSG